MRLHRLGSPIVPLVPVEPTTHRVAWPDSDHSSSRFWIPIPGNAASVFSRPRGSSRKRPNTPHTRRVLRRVKCVGRQSRLSTLTDPHWVTDTSTRHRVVSYWPGTVRCGGRMHDVFHLVADPTRRRVLGLLALGGELPRHATAVQFPLGPGDALPAHCSPAARHPTMGRVLRTTLGPAGRAPTRLAEGGTRDGRFGFPGL